MTAEGSILLVDDSAVVRKVLGDRLSELGWRVSEAADGQEGLERARAARPDIVLLDIEMPRMNGFQVLAALKRDPDLADTPVIFLTGRNSSEDVAEGLRRGAHDYLRKPFETTELQARLLVAQRVEGLRRDLRRQNAELERLATTDVLTGLRNRRFMLDELEALVSRATRHGGELSAVLLDVDHFKAINDSRGHQAGDEVLVALAGCVSTRMRLEDVCGRWGGEEFLVLLPDTGPAGALLAAEKLREAIEHDDVPVTISAGVAGLGGDGADGLLRRADAGLYAAKDAGRNAVRCVDIVPAG